MNHKAAGMVIGYSKTGVRAGSGRKITGVWDCDREPLSLGGLLILVEEMHVQAIRIRASLDGICFLGGTLFPRGTGRPDRLGLCRIPRDRSRRSAIIDALTEVHGVNAIYHSDSLEALRRDAASSEGSRFWPRLHTLSSYAYGETFVTQRFYKESGRIPHLRMKTALSRWAIQFMECNVSPSLPVVVHLKNNPGEREKSNADVDAWLGFFRDCTRRYPVKFILVGSDPLDSRLRSLPNAIVTQDRRHTLAQDLALIGAGCVYMGMASGPCAMAMFSDMPYVIYKNPGHHRKKMRQEMGAKDRFCFAAPKQKLLRMYETRKGLMSEFKKMYHGLSPASWQKRLHRLRSGTMN